MKLMADADFFLQKTRYRKCRLNLHGWTTLAQLCHFCSPTETLEKSSRSSIYSNKNPLNNNTSQCEALFIALGGIDYRKRTGIRNSSAFADIPEGLSLSNTSVPVFVAGTPNWSTAVNGTKFSVIHSPCACAG